ncbi:hypothetical protein D6833_05290, partial [Candidatus Parcubacteria bacterium]
MDMAAEFEIEQCYIEVQLSQLRRAMQALDACMAKEPVDLYDFRERLFMVQSWGERVLERALALGKTKAGLVQRLT